MEHPEQRVSGLAITSMVLGILCCVPFFGAMATVLGIGSIVAINRSRGRLMGTGFAAAGIILGLLGTTLWIGGVLAGRQVLNAVTTRCIIPMQEFSTAVEQGDVGKARTFFAPTVTVTDEDLKEFARRIEQDLGKPRGAPQNVTFTTIMQQMERIEKQTAQIQRQTGGFAVPVPIPLEFDKGTVQVVPVTRSEDFIGMMLAQGQSIQGELVNLVIIKDDGTEIWLLPPKAGGAPGTPTLPIPPPPQVPPPSPPKPQDIEKPAPPR